MGLKAVCLLGKHSVTELIPSPITPLSNTVPPLLFEGHEFTGSSSHYTVLSFPFFLPFLLCFVFLGSKPRPSSFPGKLSAPELHPSCPSRVLGRSQCPELAYAISVVMSNTVWIKLHFSAQRKVCRPQP